MKDGAVFDYKRIATEDEDEKEDDVLKAQDEDGEGATNDLNDELGEVDKPATRLSTALKKAEAAGEARSRGEVSRRAARMSA